MLLAGALLGIVAVFILTSMMGEFGLIVVGALAFGMLFSAYLKIKVLTEDIQAIKEKLGIRDEKPNDILQEMQNPEPGKENANKGSEHPNAHPDAGPNPNQEKEPGK